MLARVMAKPNSLGASLVLVVYLQSERRLSKAVSWRGYLFGLNASLVAKSMDCAGLNWRSLAVPILFP